MPLTETAIRADRCGESVTTFFSGGNRFSLLAPAELREGVEMFDWPEIKAEPSPAGGPAVENTPAPASGVPQ